MFASYMFKTRMRDSKSTFTLDFLFELRSLPLQFLLPTHPIHPQGLLMGPWDKGPEGFLLLSIVLCILLLSLV